MKGKPLLPRQPVEEEEQGSLYPVLLPAKLLTQVATIAKVQGVSTATLLATALQQFIDEHAPRSH